MLQCPVRHLCKCVVMEFQDTMPGLPRFVCAVIQYSHKLDAAALCDAVQRAVCLPRKPTKLALADPGVCAIMTGFPKNAVTPFGWATPMPVGNAICVGDDMDMCVRVCTCV
jgi:hypothetical protein